MTQENKIRGALQTLVQLGKPDYLKDLPVDALANWYRRLAFVMPQKLTPSLIHQLSGRFLLTWLENRQLDAEYEFDAPEHLRFLPAVIKVLQYHRAVFLSNAKASYGPGKPAKWAGLIPRIQGSHGKTKWDMMGELELEYESLCDPAPTAAELMRVQREGTDAERDITGSLRGFQLKSRCKVTVSPIPNSPLLRVLFKDWCASGTDRYDWDYNEHLTMPNPDYQSTAPYAVKPELPLLTVYHSNAKRLEDAKLATPFKVKIREWSVNLAGVSQETVTLDPTKKLN
jgi:hypothetical protein